ncbi:MAG TPA: DUF3726 domain-containing protein [Thermohalobaculum sp.]|nr:DUF3726 domain-containing protein [Thermohalobaculum sp.]
MTEKMSDPSIQTPTGPAKDATGHWHVSLAEIDAMGRKAARGAGLSWGLAEEAGRAARWLAAYRLPGPEALLTALRAIDGKVSACAPRPQQPVWLAEAGVLCPVATGAALSDRADRIAAGTAFRLGPVAAPLLIVPFLCRAARDLGCVIRLGNAEHELVATPDGPAADWHWLNGDTAEGLTVSLAEVEPRAAREPGAAPWRVAVETWRALDSFAHRTYAPATEASRAGAGSGVPDSD